MGRIFTVVPDARACARVLGARVDGAWSVPGGARACARRAEQRRARVEQLCVGVEQRWQGLRSVTPSPHAAGAQRLTQLRVGPRVPQR